MRLPPTVRRNDMKMDQIIKIGASVLQHGKFNDRVYLMKLSKVDFPGIIRQTESLAEENGYTKIFAKVPRWAESAFSAAGYETEAVIPHFFTGEEDACFMSRYFDGARGRLKNASEMDRVLARARNTPPMDRPAVPAGKFRHAVLGPEDAEEMAQIYRTVFETYPFPIYDPAYLRQTMEKNIVYFGVRDRGKLAAVSSCEMDEDGKNVEMTDFATLPEYRAQGLASFLLSEMEREMVKRGILTAYTIARSMSYGMNITFAKHRYAYCGTLVNNTNISGSIESMNVWYRALSK